MAMIGQPINRVDGPLKVTGHATYAYEQWEAGQPLYGFIVGATIGCGRIARIDTSSAERSPGVRLVMTHRNAPAQGTPDASIPSPHSRAKPMLNSPEIRHYGEPMALVVATTFEQARAAATLVEVDYAVEPGRFDFAARQGGISSVSFSPGPFGVDRNYAVDALIKCANPRQKIIHHFPARNFAPADFFRDRNCTRIR